MVHAEKKTHVEAAPFCLRSYSDNKFEGLLRYFLDGLFGFFCTPPPGLLSDLALSALCRGRNRLGKRLTLWLTALLLKCLGSCCAAAAP